MDVRRIERVGLIGLGKMGGPMARHVVGKGYKVAGYDLDNQLVHAAAKSGAVPATSPAEVARQSDMTIVVVGFDSEVETALFGSEGVMAAAQPSAVVVIASTIAPHTMTRIAARAKGANVHLADAPLTRGEPAAEDGTMLTMVGAETAVFEACRPVMAAYAEAIFHLGPVGAGQVGKMVNNLILWASISANEEGFALGKALGVDGAALREALLESSAMNWAMKTRADHSPMPWAEKDMMIVLQEADRLRLSLPLCGVVKEVVKAIKVAHGYPTPKAVG